MEMTKDVFDEYGNYKYPDYSNSQYTHDVSTTGGAMMGMTIDEAIKEIESIAVVTDEKQALAFALAVHTMKKYQMMRADYETRLKADMVAMLENLRLRANETQGHKYDSNFWEGFYTYDDIIKADINTLKGENT